MRRSVKQSDVKNDKISRKRPVRKIVAAAAVILAVFICLSFIGAGIIFELIFRRTETTGNIYEYSRSDAEKYPRSEIEIISGNERLFGHVYDVPDSRGVVLLCSGFHENTECHLPEVFFLADSGYDVVTFDFTGHGRSSGSGINGFSQARSDVNAALEYIRSNEVLSCEPVFLLGYSMGAYAAAASLSGNGDVRGAVCISAFNDPLGYMYSTGISHAGPIASLGIPFLWMWSRIRCGEEHGLTAIDSINESGIPVLVLYGSDDKTVPPDQSLYAKENECTAPGSTFVLVTEPERNRHMTILMSESSAAEMKNGAVDDAGKVILDSGMKELILGFLDNCA